MDSIPNAGSDPRNHLIRKKKRIVYSQYIGLNTVFYGQKPRFKEKALCHAQIVIFYPAMSGTLLTAVTKKSFCLNFQKTENVGVTGCLRNKHGHPMIRLLLSYWFNYLLLNLSSWQINGCLWFVDPFGRVMSLMVKCLLPTKRTSIINIQNSSC